MLGKLRSQGKVQWQPSRGIKRKTLPKQPASRQEDMLPSSFLNSVTPVCLTERSAAFKDCFKDKLEMSSPERI
jgi:hypothetical protein